MSAPSPSHFRVARPTDRLEDVVAFYRNALGMEEIGRFEDHGGFDGVMLAHHDHSWHLEFTHTKAHPIPDAAPSPEHLLVFYFSTPSEWDAAVEQIETLGHRPVASLNPYWDRAGRTYCDPDGYRVVLQNADWMS